MRSPHRALTPRRTYSVQEQEGGLVLTKTWAAPSGPCSPLRGTAMAAAWAGRGIPGPSPGRGSHPKARAGRGHLAHPPGTRESRLSPLTPAPSRGSPSAFPPNHISRRAPPRTPFPILPRASAPPPPPIGCRGGAAGRWTTSPGVQRGGAAGGPRPIRGGSGAGGGARRRQQGEAV